MPKPKPKEEEHFYCEACNRDLGPIRSAGFYIRNHQRLCAACDGKAAARRVRGEADGDESLQAAG